MLFNLHKKNFVLIQFPMTRTEIATITENLNFNIEQVTPAHAKESFIILLNLVEGLAASVEALTEENQKLKDEINRLKGEQGLPEFKGKKHQKVDISSFDSRLHKEKRGKKGPRNRASKIDRIKIDRIESCPVNKEVLPADAIFKGYEEVIIQDLKIVTDNVKYLREVYYSPSEKKTYRGTLPESIEGEFGPGIKSLIFTMKYVCNMSEPNILEFLQNLGIQISAAYISSLLTSKIEVFHAEKNELYIAGLESMEYQQIDDTTARVNGENHYTQVVCNPLYTAYFTTEHKDRLTILDVLRNFAPRRFVFNNETTELLEKFNLSKKVITRLSNYKQDQFLSEEDLNSILDELKLGKNQRSRVQEASAIAAYHLETEIPVVKLGRSDDVPQFKLIADEMALCWIHDGRHYKKLNPVVQIHQDALTEYRTTYWEYYQKLVEFKEDPRNDTAEQLEEEFARLFSTTTGYDDLDDRIAKTKDKKEELLAVLRHPIVPLHNNDAELGARAQVRVRDVSLQTKTEAGTKAKDTFLSIVQTAKKLGVNIYDYIYDRVCGKFELPSLAQVIIDTSQEDNITHPTIPP